MGKIVRPVHVANDNLLTSPVASTQVCVCPLSANVTEAEGE